MARPRYPSDEARVKTRPHVQVHLQARTHRIMGPVFAKVVDRGLVAGLWMTAFQAHATATGDIVTMTHADLCWVAGRERPPAAARELARVCARAGYRVWFHPRNEPVPHWLDLRADLARTPCQPGADPVPVPSEFGAVSVHVRNLAKKQIWHSTRRGEHSAHSAASELRTPNSNTEERERDSEVGSEGDAEGPGSLALSLLSAVACATDWTEDQARVWLEANGPHAQAEVAANPPRGSPEAALEAKLLRWAKAEKKPPRFKSRSIPVGEKHPKRILARKRLAYRGITDPSEAHIRLEFEQFPDVLGEYVGPSPNEGDTR